MGERLHSLILAHAKVQSCLFQAGKSGIEEETAIKKLPAHSRKHRRSLTSPAELASRTTCQPKR